MPNEKVQCSERMVAGGWAWTDSIHGLSGLGVGGRSLPSSSILPRPPSQGLQCDCGVESCKGGNGSDTQHPTPWNVFLFCLLPFPPHTPSSSPPPQPHFLSPSLGQRWQPLASYCRTLIGKKKQLQLGVFLIQGSLFLTEKKDEQIILMSFAIIRRMRKTSYGWRSSGVSPKNKRLLIMCLEFLFKRK